MSRLAELARSRSTPRLVRGLTRASVVALTAIVATGGAVRLTHSGLGCESWPNCGKADGWHALIEYGNRLAGVAVGLVVLATLVAVVRLPQRRPDLTRLALWLAAGFVGQAALGALSVVLKLSPVLVMAHFLLSMALVAVAATLHARTAPPAPDAAARSEIRGLSALLVAATAVVLILGTVVTGTGPHSGANPAKPAPRFTFLPLHTISMIHGNAAILVVGLAVANLFLLRASDAPRALTRPAQLVALAVVLQAVIGITQYALGLPQGLVELHMIGATLLWLAALGYHLAVRRTATVGVTTLADGALPAATSPA